MGFVGIEDNDTGLDFVDVDSQRLVKRDSCLGVRLFGLGSASLVAVLAGKLLVERFVAQRWWELMIRQISVHAAPNLFHSEFSRLFFIETLPKATTK